MPDYRSSSGGGAVVLDDCNFHESVHLDSFDIDRTLTLVSTLIRLLFLVISFIFGQNIKHYIYELRCITSVKLDNLYLPLHRYHLMENLL
jgi:hypothetical protein